MNYDSSNYTLIMINTMYIINLIQMSNQDKENEHDNKSKTSCPIVPDFLLLHHFPFDAYVTLFL